MVCISPKSQGCSRIHQYRHYEAQNCGISAIGDISPAQIFHRQREAQNRGFGDISPEMATLVQFNMRVLVIVLIVLIGQTKCKHSRTVK